MNEQLIETLRQFGLPPDLDLLPGGSHPTFRAGHAVLKHIHETSLENNHSLQLMKWIAEFTNRLSDRDFRLPQPLPTRDGCWITEQGWTAWTFLEGRHAQAEDIPVCLSGIVALHRALRTIPKHPLMEDNRTPWGMAHRWCFGAPPASVPPPLQPRVDELYALRQPVTLTAPQLIHGDLNPENILIAPERPPAFLDLSPFWAPAEFALAIFANWIGPRRGDVTLLKHFEHIPHFGQLLIRAALRMLLVMAVLDNLSEWDTCSEKRAAELVIAYVKDTHR